GSVQPRPYHPRQSDRAAVDRALLGELSRRTSSIHVSAVLSPPRGASTPDRKGPDPANGSAARLSRCDAARHFGSAGLSVTGAGQAFASCTAAKGGTRSGPRRPAAEPARMPAAAANDANASVDSPVRPWPIEQPRAIAPPAPISAAPPAERSMWRGDR